MKSHSTNEFYINTIIKDNIRPAIAKYTPRLKAFDLGLNIQKLEITKKKSEIPKNAFKGESESFD